MLKIRELVAAALFAASFFLTTPICAQGSDFKATRTPDGVPDISGIWQVLGSASWDLEGHAARQGPWPPYGALGAIPAGQSVVEGGKIPYQDWARKKRDENRKNWVQLDPAVKCFMTGVPRATYMPFPFQIVQSKNTIMIAYEFAGMTRIVRLDRPGSEAPANSWMGYSLGRFDGDSLVVDVTDQEAGTWFDASGNFHSEELTVQERYTPTGPNSMLYEAAVKDPNVFTRPWKITMPLYRRLEENAQILEFKCVPFGEPVAYGHLYRGGPPAAVQPDDPDVKK